MGHFEPSRTDIAIPARPSRRLRTGPFRTRGRYAAVTVRGTARTTSDRHDGTPIAIQQHSVLDSDLVKHISIVVCSAHHYLAKAPAPRKRK